ncbi:hypothetical protein F5Y17DRAFT_299045 [Xylariaceae sp. FL0594]|nr:hypothetical protein F5Y17DRAFT_299045 [Xylariaceae sp. FL0594]
MPSFYHKSPRSSEQSDYSAFSFSRDRSSLSSRSNTHGSLRSRLTGLTESLTGSISLRRKRCRQSYGSLSPGKTTPDRMVASALKNGTGKHWEHMNRTWAASQKYTESMPSPSSSSDHIDSISNCTSEDYRSLIGEVSIHPSMRHLRTGSQDSHESTRRVLTQVSGNVPVAFDRVDARASRKRYSSYSSAADVSSKSDYVPRLPSLSLDDAGDFRESLRQTRIFQTLPASEPMDSAVDVTPSRAYIASALNAFLERRTSQKRLPIRLRPRDRDSFGQLNADGKPTEEDSRGFSSIHTNVYTSIINQEEPAPQPAIIQPAAISNTRNPRKPGEQMTSRTPLEWIDQILESSYLLRKPHHARARPAPGDQGMV